MKEINIEYTLGRKEMWITAHRVTYRPKAMTVITATSGRLRQLTHLGVKERLKTCISRMQPFNVIGLANGYLLAPTQVRYGSYEPSKSDNTPFCGGVELPHSNGCEGQRKIVQALTFHVGSTPTYIHHIMRR
jgi:hypothetical protein